MSFAKIFILVTLLVYATSCGHKRYKNNYPEKSELGKEFPSFKAPENSKTRKINSEINKKDELTLRDIFSLALMNNSNLRAFSWEVRAKEAKIYQADQYLNPELGVDVENILGSGNYQGFSGSEITVWINQPIKLNSEISKKRNVKEIERKLSSWDYEAKRLEILTNATKSYINLLAIQSLYNLSKNIFDLNEEVLRTVSSRVTSGKVSPMDMRNAKLSISVLELEQKKIKNLHIKYKHELASFWGEAHPTFSKVLGKLDQTHPIPTFKELVVFIEKNPKIARWAVEMQYRKALIVLEKTKNIPDLNISGGVRLLDGAKDQAFNLGVSILLPIFESNRGNILEAEYREAQASELKKQMSLNLVNILVNTYQRLAISEREVLTLRNQTLVEAYELFKSSREGYSQGKFNLLHLLEAQRLFYSTKEKYLYALSKYHKAVADIEMIIGRRITTIKGN